MVIQNVSLFVPELVAALLRLRKSEPVPLGAGIIIIGSLLCDHEQGRPAWRDVRLDEASAHNVAAPIRYGRLPASSMRPRCERAPALSGTDR